MDLLASQLAEVQQRFPEAHVDPSGDGQRLLIVPGVPVAPGWAKSQATISIIVPVGYPHVGLDCFYTEVDFCLASGAEPSNSSVQDVFGLQLRWFSWHDTGWDPIKGTLERYIRFCGARLRDAR